MLAPRVHARLADLASDGLQRALRPPSGVDLSSNDYLNLSHDPRIVAAFIGSAAREGAGSTGSRLLRGHRDTFSAVEHRFAVFKQAERALYFSSGYLANLAVLSTFTEADDVVFSDERNHASLIDGCRLSRARVIVCPHGDVERLALLVKQVPCSGTKFVVVESLYSMDGDVPPLADYAALCESIGATLVVDEAHAVGVCGARGSGLIEASGLDSNQSISINSGGKALGVAGAFVAGPAWAIEYLVQRARPFIFSTAPPPAVADALSASLTVVQDEPERRTRLEARARYLRRLLAESGVDVPQTGSHIVPVHIGNNERAVAVAEAIQAQGFDVRAVRPPTVPPGTARLRVSLNAGLSEDVLAQFVDVLHTSLAAARTTVSA